VNSGCHPDSRSQLESFIDRQISPDFYTRYSGLSIVSAKSPRTFVVSTVRFSEYPEFSSLGAILPRSYLVFSLSRLTVLLSCHSSYSVLFRRQFSYRFHAFQPHFISLYRCSLFCQLIWPMGFALEIGSALPQAKDTLSPDE
jgi:hypothetical protein